tara:strand:+ start:326 stop:640 length:315 start_codon:yes stop_codon:yes gene_type:complete
MPNTYTVNLYPVPTLDGIDERLVVSTTPISFSTTWNTSDTRFVLVNFQSANAMVTFDGSAPSASNGFLYESGWKGYWSVRQADSAIMIRSASTDVAVQASPFTV